MPVEHRTAVNHMEVNSTTGPDVKSSDIENHVTRTSYYAPTSRIRWHREVTLPFDPILRDAAKCLLPGISWNCHCGEELLSQGVQQRLDCCKELDTVAKRVDKLGVRTQEGRRTVYISLICRSAGGGHGTGIALKAGQVYLPL
jgi:hypothetical protein